MSDMSAVPKATVGWVPVVVAGALAQVAAPIPLVAPVPRQAIVGGATPVCFAYANALAAFYQDACRSPTRGHTGQ